MRPLSVLMSSILSMQHGAILLLLFVFISFTETTLLAQPVEWVRSIVSADYSAGSDISIDTRGNVLIAGVYRDEITYHNDPQFRLSNQGKTDIMLIKTTSDGDVQWQRTIGGVGEDKVFRIATDQQNNIYITGSFERVIRFEKEGDTHTLESMGKEDAFLAKFDTDGNIVWSIRAGGARSDQGIGLSVDDTGNVYMAGYFEEEATFGMTTPLISTGQLDAFIARFNPEGELDWVRSLGGIKRDLASGVAVDSSGKVYVAGVTRGPEPLNLDPQIVQGAPAGQDDLYLARYSAEGDLESFSYSGGRGFDAVNGIVIDDANRIYITGFFEDEAALHDLQGNAYLIQGQSFDVFVARFEQDGSLSWVNTAGGERWDNAYDLDVDHAGNVYVTGLFRDVADFTVADEQANVEGAGEANAFVVKYRNNGSIVGLQMIDGPKSEGAGVAANASGDVFLTGIFVQEAVFKDSDASLSSTSFNSFIVKYNPQGLDNSLPGDELQRANLDRPLFAVSQNYPNPFAEQTILEVELAETAHVRLIVHDILGRVLTEVHNNELAAGLHRFIYNAGQLAKGTYFYTLETTDSRLTRTMVVE